MSLPSFSCHGHRRACLILSAVGVVASGLSHAQSTRSVGTFAPDARLVVTGTRLPMTQDLLAADVVVIERADIEASTADSLADLLRREAGVQL